MTDFNPNNPYNGPQICDFIIKNIYLCVPSDQAHNDHRLLIDQLLEVMPQYYKLQNTENRFIFGLASPYEDDFNVAWYTVDKVGQRTLHWTTLADFTFDIPVYGDVAP